MSGENAVVTVTGNAAVLMEELPHVPGVDHEFVPWSSHPRPRPFVRFDRVDKSSLFQGSTGPGNVGLSAAAHEDVLCHLESVPAPLEERRGLGRRPSALGEASEFVEHEAFHR